MWERRTGNYVERQEVCRKAGRLLKGSKGFKAAGRQGCSKTVGRNIRYLEREGGRKARRSKQKSSIHKAERQQQSNNKVEGKQNKTLGKQH